MNKALEDHVKEFEKSFAALKQRNLRVEANKAWETSLFRKITIAIATYIVASIVMYFIGVSNYLGNALIPTIGYILSTLSLPFVKSWWISRYLSN